MWTVDLGSDVFNDCGATFHGLTAEIELRGHWVALEGGIGSFCNRELADLISASSKHRELEHRAFVVHPNWKVVNFLTQREIRVSDMCDVIHNVIPVMGATLGFQKNSHE